MRSAPSLLQSWLLVLVPFALSSCLHPSATPSLHDCSGCLLSAVLLCFLVCHFSPWLLALKFPLRCLQPWAKLNATFPSEHQREEVGCLGAV